MREIVLKTRETEKESVILCGDVLFELKRRLSAYSEALVFTDCNVYGIYKDLLREMCGSVPVHVMEAGEAHKTPETLSALLGAMARSGLHRGGVLVAFGGGVAGDVGGLAAALYMRGIDCIQVPTTLLAQVDSSVGGKTAVNFNGVKNLIGAFKQPECVLADGRFLKTLSPREIRCGLGEMIKHAALSEALFDKMQEGRNRLFELGFLEELIPENIALKASVVAQDAKERGIRKSLNLGHTTAHALELSDHTLSHGEYVLLGMILEGEIAKNCMECDGAYLDELKELCLLALGDVLAVKDIGGAAELARFDKKNENSAEVTLTVPTVKGKYGLLKIPCAEYAERLRQAWRTIC